MPADSGHTAIMERPILRQALGTRTKEFHLNSDYSVLECHPEPRRSRREGPYDTVKFRCCGWECPKCKWVAESCQPHCRSARFVRSLRGLSPHQTDIA